MHFKDCHIRYSTKQSTRRHIHTKDHRISNRPEESYKTRIEVWISQDTCSNIKQPNERVHHNAAPKSWY